MDRRQFLKGTAGAFAVAAIPLPAPHPWLERLSADELVKWKSKTPQDIFDDIQSLIYDVRYPELEGMV